MRDHPEQEALGLLAVGALGVRQRLQPVHALLDAGIALTPARLEVRLLFRGEAMLGPQPGEDVAIILELMFAWELAATVSRFTNRSAYATLYGRSGASQHEHEHHLGRINPAAG